MANHKKQYCPKGHDTFITGRNSANGCKVCRQAYQILYNKKPEQKAAVKRWSESHKDERKDQEYRRTYGITLVDYKQMCAKQDGMCLICKDYKSLVVDHCHKTGTIRGLLCSQCNRAMGLFVDDPVRLQSAVEYLSR